MQRFLLIFMLLPILGFSQIPQEILKIRDDALNSMQLFDAYKILSKQTNEQFNNIYKPSNKNEDNLKSFEKELHLAEMLLKNADSKNFSNLFCVSGECDLSKSENSEDINEGLKQLTLLTMGAEDVSSKQLASKTPGIFTGNIKKCKKYPLGFRDCCKDTGWGEWVKQCPKDLQDLQRAKHEGRVIQIGSYKNKKLGSRHYTYCVFPSKIAAIVQHQGRFEQLKISFGTAEAPSCRGLNPKEFSSINFDLLDLSSIEQAILKRVRLPDTNTLVSNAQNKAQSLYLQERAHA